MGRLVLHWVCVFALGVVPLFGCGETAGIGGTGGDAGTGGVAGIGGVAGSGGSVPVGQCTDEDPDSDWDGICDANDTCDSRDDSHDADCDAVPDDCCCCEGFDEIAELVLIWPLPGNDGADWVINNYVDLDPTNGGKQDYTGAVGTFAKTYDGHRGIDIDIPTFRAMDAGVPVLAAAPGEVIALHDCEPDRNTRCKGTWNFVRVRHADGSVAIYGHLKTGSVSVELGDWVLAGDTIGAIGSSGCSTAAHLHFEWLSCSDEVLPPFAKAAWEAPPRYDTELAIMDFVVRRHGISGTDQVKDPGENATSMLPGEKLGLGLSVAGGDGGDTVGVRVLAPGDAIAGEYSRILAKPSRHTYWHWNHVLSAEEGEWTVEMLLNGVVVSSHNVTVASLPASAVPQGSEPD